MVTTRSRAASLHQARVGLPPDLETGSNSSTVGKPAATRSIDTFQYQKLEDGSKDIRLVVLSPGQPGEPVVLQIKHARLPEYDEPVATSHERTLQKVATTLPPDWEVFETLEGRLIFTNNVLDVSSWTHPGNPDLKLPDLTTTLEVPETPEFEALSYTWGSPHSRKAVFIENPAKSGQSKILATKNLHVALQNLRYSNRTRTLWVDAICINQQDIAERNAQVQRMPHIYRLAHRVVIWIGPGSRQSALAMSTLRYLAEQVEVTRQTHTIGIPGAAEKEWYANSHDLPYDDETWRAILRLFQRVWFTRVWVVQEVNLANTRAIIQCGADATLWVMFRRAVLCLSTKHNLPTQDTSIRSEIATVVGLANYDAATAHTRLVESIEDRNCSDQRDRVFGLLGLMPEGLRKRMPVDYSLEVGEIYKRSTLAQIEHFGRLDVLRGCGDMGFDDRAINAPSWVPDLIMPQPAMVAIGQFSSGMSRCTARQIDPDVLKVVGIQVGTISTPHDAFSSWLGDGVKVVRTWQLPDLNSPYPSGGSLLDALVMTICSMKVEDRHPRLQRLPTFEEWKSYCREFILGGQGPLEEKSRVSDLYLSSFEYDLYEKRLFAMTGGYIGLGPLGLKPGKICS